MKNFTFLCIFITSIFQAQNASKDLDAISDTDQAEAFLIEKANKKNKLITFNEAKHKTQLAKELLDKGIGGKATTETDFEHIHYKVIEKYDVSHYRVSYILLNGKDKTLDEINATRNSIISKYEKGLFSFAQLAKQYSVSRNATRGGDTGWFIKGKLSPAFEDAVINSSHDVNDIFTIDDLDKHWYYVVLKTHKPESITEIKVLKVVEPK